MTDAWMKAVGRLMIRLEETMEEVPWKDLADGLSQKDESTLSGFIKMVGLKRTEDGVYSTSRNSLLSFMSRRLDRERAGLGWMDVDRSPRKFSDFIKILLESEQWERGVLYLSDFQDLVERSGMEIEDYSPEEIEDVFLESGMKRVKVLLNDIPRIGYASGAVGLREAAGFAFGPGNVQDVDEGGGTVTLTPGYDMVTRQERALDKEQRERALEFARRTGEVTTGDVVRELGITDPGPGAKANSEVAILLKKAGFRAEIRQVGKKAVKVFRMRSEDAPEEPAPDDAPDRADETRSRTAKDEHGLDSGHPGWREAVDSFIIGKTFTFFDEISVRVLGKLPHEFNKYQVYRVAMRLIDAGMVTFKRTADGRAVYHRAGMRPSNEEVKAVADGLTMEQNQGLQEPENGLSRREMIDLVALKEAVEILGDGLPHSKAKLFKRHFDGVWQLKVLKGLIMDGYVVRSGDRLNAEYVGVPQRLSQLLDGGALHGSVRASGAVKDVEEAHAEEADGEGGPEEGPVPEEAADDGDEKDPVEELRTLVAEMFEVLKEQSSSIRSLRARVRRLEEELGRPD